MEPNALDPTVSALAKSIAKTESGVNYNAVGDGGNSSGAYQMSQAFVDKWAPTVLGGTSSYDAKTLTPEQQDQLAYGAVKAMGSTGDPGYEHLGKLTPAQIASAWNAGDPNAYLDPNYGKNNKYGSTANYVSEVEKNYNQFLGQPSQTTSNPLIPSAEAASTPPQTQGGSSYDLNQAFNPLASGPNSMGSSLLNNIGTAGPAAALSFLGGALPGALGIGGSIASGLGGTALKALGLGSIGEAGITFYKSLFGGSSPAPQQPTGQGTDQPGMSNELSALLAESAPAQKASQGLLNQTLQELGATVGGTKIANDPQNREALQTIGTYGMAPEIKDGRMDYTNAFDNSKNHIKELSNAAEGMLSEEGGTGNADEIGREAKSQLRLHASSEHWAEGDKAIDDIVGGYRKNFGNKHGDIPLAHVERMRKEMGPGAKFDATESNSKRAAKRALYHGARNTITKHTKHKELYNRIMKEEQKLINAQKIIKKLHGKKARHNSGLLPKLLKEAGAIASGYLGKKIGGPVGAIIGYLAGEHIIRAVDKRYGKSMFESQGMKHLMKVLGQKSPATLRVILAELKKAHESAPTGSIHPDQTPKGKHNKKGHKPKGKTHKGNHPR